MKHGLPDSHGLSESILEHLTYKHEGEFFLTDIQSAALEHGLAHGTSTLIVSPTSTGKTLIAEWAIANGIEAQCQTVYLVTHRALAKQKFRDFQQRFQQNFLDNNPRSIVLATGDEVIDGEGESPADPLAASILVATYEKYLALLSSTGIPTNMLNTVVVCDEIQLIGDENRGQNVEVLLTLLKNAGWKQLVALSAVLTTKDASNLANWLGVVLINMPTREKHLTYEYWHDDKIYYVNTDDSGSVQQKSAPAGVTPSTLSVLSHLLSSGTPPTPIIVFCMRKQDIYDLSQACLNSVVGDDNGQLSLAFDELPETSASTFLARALANRIAIHSSDLTDEERHIVEQHILDKSVDVVFATSTLAAGVNFPLGAAIFASITRYDFGQQRHVPIDTSEFHNMAGRVGRMGFDHDYGRVIFTQNDKIHGRTALSFLDLGALPDITPKLSPNMFDQLSLQLIATGLCSTRADVINIICSSFSGLLESDNNAEAFSHWPVIIDSAVSSLVNDTLIVENGSGILSATPIGKTVSNTGLQPQTALFLLKYATAKADVLQSMLPSPSAQGDIDTLSLLLFTACLISPEFTPTGGNKPSRFLPWPLGKDYYFDASNIAHHLADPVWHAHLGQINGGKLAVDWISGSSLGELERALPNLTAGMLRELFRNIAWVISGFASVVNTASDQRVPDALRPDIIRGNDHLLHSLSQLPRVMRRLAFRISEGLPDEVLWMLELNHTQAQFTLSRTEILSFLQQGYHTPESLMLGTPEADAVRMEAFKKTKPTPHAKANWLRDAVRNWKKDQRTKTAQRHSARSNGCAKQHLVEAFYGSFGNDFESAFEAILEHLNINYHRLDQKGVTGAPDYLLDLHESPSLVIELKSKMNDKLVDYNGATEVLAASEIHGYKDANCVTLCHPGVDPSVPLVIASCGRLCVVESSDLGEGLLRLCEKTISQQQLWQWLATPGQALTCDLPFTQHDHVS